MSDYLAGSNLLIALTCNLTCYITLNRPAYTTSDYLPGYNLLTYLIWNLTCYITLNWHAYTTSDYLTGYNLICNLTCYTLTCKHTVQLTSKYQSVKLSFIELYLSIQVAVTLTGIHSSGYHANQYLLETFTLLVSSFSLSLLVSVS